MDDPNNKPKDRYVVIGHGGRLTPEGWVIVHKTYEWWRRRGIWLEKTTETKVGGHLYSTPELAQDVADQLNGEGQ